MTILLPSQHVNIQIEVDVNHDGFVVLPADGEWLKVGRAAMGGGRVNAYTFPYYLHKGYSSSCSYASSSLTVVPFLFADRSISYP